MKLTVAMITRNEAGAVTKVVRDILAVVPGADVLVVDSSDDRTAELAQAAGARVIRQYPPRGYGAAMDKALRSAQGEVVITLDCDDTYPTNQIPVLARLVLDEGYDLVDGSRLERKPAAMPWFNFLANWGFAWMASVLFLQRFTDLHSGMRAYRKSMIDELVFDPSGPALPVELLLRPVSLGYRCTTAFIDYRERVGVSTMQPLISAWWTLKRILAVRFRPGRRPDRA